MNKLFLKILFSCIIGCSMMNSMAMDNATASEKESAEGQRHSIVSEQASIDFETQFKNITDAFIIELTRDDQFSPEDTQSNFFTCHTHEDKDAAGKYFEELIRCICKSFQSKTEHSRTRLDVRPLEDLIVKQLEKRFIIINPQDFCAQEGEKLKIAPESQIMLETFDKIGREAATLKSMILKQTKAGTPPEDLAKQIIEQTRDVIRKKIEEAFKKIREENPNAQYIVHTQPKKEPSYDKKEAGESAPKNSCSVSNWKGYAITATIASAATLGIACAVLKASGYKLIK